MINQKFNDPEKTIEELHQQLNDCKKIIDKKFVVIGLGGTESWLTTLAANEVFGRYQVLAVNVYSVFSNSIIPHKISAVCQENNIEYCDVDLSNTISDFFSTPIGLFRIEKEKLHYMMSDLQKAQIIAMLRYSLLKSIADRHDGILLSGISLSKRLLGWVSPDYSMFDWNPLENITYNQVQLAIKNYNMGMELLETPSGLDLDTRGGPFPSDVGIDLTNNIFKKKKINCLRLGLGNYQKEKTNES